MWTPPPHHYLLKTTLRRLDDTHTGGRAAVEDPADGGPLADGQPAGGSGMQLRAGGGAVWLHGVLRVQLRAGGALCGCTVS